MNKVVLGIALPCALLFFTSNVLANGSTYVAGNVIGAQYDLINEDSNADLEDSIGFNVAIGKYVGDRMSVEIGYADYGFSDRKYSDSEVTAKSLQASVIGYAPMGAKGGLFGRVGIERTKSELKYNNQGFGSNVEYDTSSYFGVGGYYNLSGGVDMRVEYQRHDEEVETVSAGITFNTL